MFLFCLIKKLPAIFITRNELKSELDKSLSYNDTRISIVSKRVESE